MHLELCWVWVCDHSLREPVQCMPQSLWWRTVSQHPVWPSRVTAPCHSLGSCRCHQWAEISACPSAPLMRKPQAAMRSSLSLLCSGLNNSKDLSCSSYILPSRPFTIFVALLWMLSNSFMCILCCVPKTAHSNQSETALAMSRVSDCSLQSLSPHRDNRSPQLLIASHLLSIGQSKLTLHLLRAVPVPLSPLNTLSRYIPNSHAEVLNHTAWKKSKRASISPWATLPETVPRFPLQSQWPLKC